MDEFRKRTRTRARKKTNGPMPQKTHQKAPTQKNTPVQLPENQPAKESITTITKTATETTATEPVPLPENQPAKEATVSITTITKTATETTATEPVPLPENQPAKEATVSITTITKTATDPTATEVSSTVATIEPTPNIGGATANSTTNDEIFPFNPAVAIIPVALLLLLIFLGCFYKRRKNAKKSDEEGSIENPNRKVRFSDEATPETNGFFGHLSKTFSQSADMYLPNSESQVPPQDSGIKESFVPFKIPDDEEDLQPKNPQTFAAPPVPPIFQNDINHFEVDEDWDVNDEDAPLAPTSHVVIVPYYPQHNDEMQLQEGDLIGIEKEYPDGWARGQNISQGGQRTYFPMACVTTVNSGPSQTVRKDQTLRKVEYDENMNTEKDKDVVTQRMESMQNENRDSRQSYGTINEGYR
jgi:hypothetical protein